MCVIRKSHSASLIYHGFVCGPHRILPKSNKRTHTHTHEANKWKNKRNKKGRERKNVQEMCHKHCICRCSHSPHHYIQDDDNEIVMVRRKGTAYNVHRTRTHCAVVSISSHAKLYHSEKHRLRTNGTEMPLGIAHARTHTHTPKHTWVSNTDRRIRHE